MMIASSCIQPVRVLVSFVMIHKHDLWPVARARERDHQAQDPQMMLPTIAM